jgi:hypothetical protein
MADAAPFAATRFCPVSAFQTYGLWAERLLLLPTYVPRCKENNDDQKYDSNEAAANALPRAARY